MMGELWDKKPENDYGVLNQPVQRAVPRMPDPVNHPAYYIDGGIETIDFIEAKKLNYNRGNAVKYITRAGKKQIASLGYEAEIQDLEKAVWYLNREIHNLRR